MSLPRVEVDLAQLETALLNAAFNARDAMPDGGRLTLATRACDEGKIMIEVADTGTGMTAEVRDRAFEPFFTTKPVGEGTGLGLSQIHGFAAQAGGHAEIRSAAGEGTAIRIYLPATDRPLGGSVESVRAPKPPRDLRVLLVEDNEHVREFAHHLLDELGYRVLSVASGEEALEVLGREPVDLLFSDVVMPGLSGLELARLARNDHPSLPVLLASGYSEEIVGSAGSEFEIVRKPYEVTLLEAALGAALERSAAQPILS
jgi:CheY-like chemotaxis protein